MSNEELLTRLQHAEDILAEIVIESDYYFSEEIAMGLEQYANDYGIDWEQRYQEFRAAVE
jgi:hypothetical protein